MDDYLNGRTIIFATYEITKFIIKHWVWFINESEAVPSQTHMSRIVEPNQSINQWGLCSTKVHITYYYINM